MVTDINTGEDILYLYRWTFGSDGSVNKVSYRCKVDTNGSEYYFGRCWSPYEGDAGTGTYTLNGDILSITARDVNGDTYFTNEYPVEYNGSILCIENKGRPMNFTKTD